MGRCQNGHEKQNNPAGRECPQETTTTDCMKQVSGELGWVQWRVCVSVAQPNQGESEPSCVCQREAGEQEKESGRETRQTKIN